MNKLEEQCFKTSLKNFDILCLQETHVPSNDILPVFEKFRVTPHCRNVSSNNRFFGGMLMFVRKSIEKGVKFGKREDKDIFEVTLKKRFFGLEDDITFFFTYASPINSCYTKSRSENVLDKIETKIIGGDDIFFIMGDLNGHTKEGDDFVRDENDNRIQLNNPTYKTDKNLGRTNADRKPIDTQGKKILDLCKFGSCRILNGRVTGDKSGSLTRFPSSIRETPSAIDYTLCSTSLMGTIHSFSVAPFTGLSDHCCISVFIRVNMMNVLEQPTNCDERECTVHPISTNFTYDNKRREVFEHLLLTNENLPKLSQFLNKNEEINQDVVDTSISYLNDILLTSAKKAFPRKHVAKSRTLKRKVNRKGWFTKECARHKRHFREASKKLSKNPFNKPVLDKFIKSRTAYKKVCRKAEKSSRDFLTRQLIKMEGDDPNKFWKIIEKMNKWGKEMVDPSSNIPSSEWKKHFEDLLIEHPGKNTSLNSRTVFETFEPILDRCITKEDLRDALKYLKHGKSSGPDGIMAEYVKDFGRVAEGILLKLMKMIFSNHIYPDKWTTNFLKPIHKNNEVKVTDNYRGLAIGSTFAKLHSFIMLSRLNKYIEEKQLISPNQIGFMKGSRTSDHIFLLQTIIEKVVKKNKQKLYGAFIDFTKAYDTVSRDTLFKHLKHFGINGVWFKNLVAMYQKTDYLVKYKNGHLDAISSNLGLKQGCPLSPMLFNLYVDGIGNIFDAECEPIMLQDKCINHFLYADDLTLSFRYRVTKMPGQFANFCQ